MPLETRRPLAALLPPAAAVAAALAAALAGVACGTGDDAPAVERADSAGIDLVTSGSRDVPLPWTPRERLALGGQEEGPESFYRLTPELVGADDAGRLHVLDWASHRVVVFDAGGGVVRTLGREGGGPGELDSPATLQVTGDGTVSGFDYGKGALVLWDSAGRTLPERLFPHRPMIGGRHHALADGAYLASTGGLDDQGRRANRLIRVAGEDTTLLASIHQPNRESPAMFPSCGGGINFPPLFTPHVVWDHRGGLTAVAPEAAYRVDLYRDGRLVRSVRRAIDPAPATKELAIAEAGDGFRIDFGRGPCVVPPDEYAEARGWAPTVPAIADLRIAPDGGLWVQRRIPGDEHPPIDVFAADGAYRGTLPAGTPFPALLLPDGAAAVITSDEMDVNRLVVLEPVEAASAP